MYFGEEIFSLPNMRMGRQNRNTQIIVHPYSRYAKFIYFGFGFGATISNEGRPRRTVNLALVRSKDEGRQDE